MGLSFLLCLLNGTDAAVVIGDAFMRPIMLMMAMF